MAKLDEYQRKRRFDRTPEPAGPVPAEKGPEPSSENTFVVQKHAARRLHYDFRLAINGTLKSWAVPKGPSLSSTDKRLAVQTEDHPLEYGGFEGKIPEGNYGAGTVMVWDRGTFATEGNLDAARQLQRGEIKFSLNGEKLHGSFVLVKLRNSEKGNEWLFIKHKDATEDPAWNVDEHDGSVLTGRTLEEIKEESPPKRKPSPMQPEELNGARKSAMPSRLEPMLATLGEHPVSQIPVVYFAFDLLYCDGYDLRQAPLLERKQLLERLLHTSERFRYSDHQLERGKELFELARQNGLEGIIAKRADSSYVSDRSANWAKLKVSNTIDAVVGGWTAARTSAIPFGSLLLGLYQGKPLRFIGHVGSGFDTKKLEEISGKLKSLASSSCPFETAPEANEKPSWVTPSLVARVKFSGWTQERSLRHPVFVALREDARPTDCQWENEVAIAAPAAAPVVVRAPEVVGRVLNTK